MNKLNEKNTHLQIQRTESCLLKEKKLKQGEGKWVKRVTCIVMETKFLVASTPQCTQKQQYNVYTKQCINQCYLKKKVFKRKQVLGSDSLSPLISYRSRFLNLSKHQPPHFGVFGCLNEFMKIYWLLYLAYCNVPSKCYLLLIVSFCHPHSLPLLDPEFRA